MLEEPAASPPPASWALMSVSSGRALLLFSEKGGEKGAEKGAEKGGEKARSTQRKRTDRRRRFLQPLQHASLRLASALRLCRAPQHCKATAQSRRRLHRAASDGFDEEQWYTGTGTTSSGTPQKPRHRA